MVRVKIIIVCVIKKSSKFKLFNTKPIFSLFSFLRIVADILNILQPLYVFVIFCCKKNVWDTIRGRDRRKTIISTARAKRKTAESAAGMRMTDMSKGKYSTHGTMTSVTDVSTHV